MHTHRHTDSHTDVCMYTPCKYVYTFLLDLGSDIRLCFIQNKDSPKLLSSPHLLRFKNSPDLIAWVKYLCLSLNPCVSVMVYNNSKISCHLKCITLGYVIGIIPKMSQQTIVYPENGTHVGCMQDKYILRMGHLLVACKTSNLLL